MSRLKEKISITSLIIKMLLATVIILINLFVIAIIISNIIVSYEAFYIITLWLLFELIFIVVLVIYPRYKKRRQLGTKVNEGYTLLERLEKIMQNSSKESLFKDDLEELKQIFNSNKNINWEKIMLRFQNIKGSTLSYLKEFSGNEQYFSILEKGELLIQSLVRLLIFLLLFREQYVTDFVKITQYSSKELTEFLKELEQLNDIIEEYLERLSITMSNTNLSGTITDVENIISYTQEKLKKNYSLDYIKDIKQAKNKLLKMKKEATDIAWLNAQIAATIKSFVDLLYFNSGQAIQSQMVKKWEKISKKQHSILNEIEKLGLEIDSSDLITNLDDLLAILRLNELKKLTEEQTEITTDTLQKRLVFDNPIELEDWLITISEQVKIKIIGDKVVFTEKLAVAQQEITKTIDNLLETYDRWTKAGKGKKI